MRARSSTHGGAPAAAEAVPSPAPGSAPRSPASSAAVSAAYPATSGGASPASARSTGYAYGGVRRSSPATMWRIASTSSSRVVSGLIPCLVPASVTFPSTTLVATSAWKADGTLSGSPSTFSWPASASANTLRAGDGDCQVAPGRVAAPRGRPRRIPPDPTLPPPARLDLATTTLRTHPSEHATLSMATEPPRDPRNKHRHPFGNL